MATRKGAPSQITIDELFTQIRRLIGICRDVMERYAHLAEATEDINRQRQISNEMVEERFIEVTNEMNLLTRQVERLERIIILDRFGQRGSTEDEALRADIRHDQDEKTLRRLLAQEVSNLNKLRLRESKYGGTAPLDVLNQIEDTETNIKRIRSELDE